MVAFPEIMRHFVVDRVFFRVRCYVLCSGYLVNFVVLNKWYHILYENCGYIMVTNEGTMPNVMQ